MPKPLTAALIALSIVAAPALAQDRLVDQDHMLALVAMPLAVAAAAELSGVSAAELIDVVTLLNEADVPPAQFIEVVRYAPVALVVEEQRRPFVATLRESYDSGVRGEAFVTVVEQQLRPYELGDFELTVSAPRVTGYERDLFFPPIVRERVQHPHGGPPGQLKKQLGLQTGAEVVHGERRGRGSDPLDAILGPDRDDRREVRGKDKVPPGQAKKQGRSDGNSKGKGKGKGKS